MIGESGFEAQPGQIIVSGYRLAAYALRLNSRAGTEGSTASFLICDRWLILGSETLSISPRWVIVGHAHTQSVLEGVD